MPASSHRLSLLFAGAIALPTLVLAYLGLQSVEDDGHRILAEQQRLAALARAHFEHLLDRALEVLGQVPDPRGTNSEGMGDRPDHFLRHVFALDRQRRWVVPRLSPPRGARVSGAFAEAMADAEQAEFGAGDVGRAVSLFRGIVEGSRDGAERAIALNAVARCALKLGNPAAALQAYALLIRDSPAAVNEAGEHLATYAHLQEADLLLAAGRRGEALAALADWARAIDRGAYPVQEGSTYHLDQAGALAGRAAADAGAAPPGPELRAAARALQDRIATTAARLRFAASLDGTIRQPELPDSLYWPDGRASLLRSGQHRGVPYLIAIVPRHEDLLVGAELDLPAIQEQLDQALQAQTAASAGYHLAVLDDRGAASFRQERGEDLSLVGGLSDRAVGLRLGLYAADAASLRRQYQRRRWLLLSSVGLLAATIGFGGYLLVRDAARERRLSELRAGFVSSVSHELKTPLASIRLFAETLLMGRVQGEQERVECLEAIVQEGDRLTRLVDNVLEFARIEKGRKSYHLRDEDLAEIARTCLDLFRYRLRAEGFEVVTEIPEQVRPLALDRDAVTQAILNLLSNAVKYSPEDRKIALRVAEGGSGPVVEVADRGIGLQAEDRERIFEPFYRADTGPHQATGAGLGLTVVRHVMEAHRGRVEVDSAAGRGATFRLVFPRPSEV